MDKKREKGSPGEKKLSGDISLSIYNEQSPPLPLE